MTTKQRKARQRSQSYVRTIHLILADLKKEHISTVFQLYGKHWEDVVSRLAGKL